MQVSLFIPCFIDQLYPQTAFNVLKIFKKLGISAHYNPEQTCCGQPALNSGYQKEARVVAEKFLHDFKGEHYVVSPSASCSGYVKNQFQDLLEGTNKQAFDELAPRIYELSDFLVNVIGETNLGASFPHKVTYHDSCSALREYRLKDEPRKLLAQVIGLELVEMEDTHNCCGFGGTFSAKFTSISTEMTRQKVQRALETEARYIVSTDSSCLLNIQGYLNKNGHALEVLHLADVLASGY